MLQCFNNEFSHNIYLSYFAAPPKFLKEIDETITLKTGGSHAIEIPFSAYPMPKVEWHFKTGKLPDAKRFKPETIIGMTAMTIAKVVRKDSGIYTLTLENEHGKCDCKFTLIVLG
jgi:titin